MNKDKLMSEGKQMDFVDMKAARLEMIRTMLRFYIVKAIFLILDATILWLAWALVLVPTFHVPELSKWAILGLLFTYRFVIQPTK
jgi:hypothetical protein